MLRKVSSSVRLASVKSSKTKPISARRRKTVAFNPALMIDGRAGNISHSRCREHHRRRDNRSLKAARHQTEGEEEREKQG